MPLTVQRLLPPEFAIVLEQQALNLTMLLNEVALIGLAYTFLGLLKGFVDKASLLHLATSIGSNVIWLLFTLIFLGLGDFKQFGIATISTDIGEEVTNMVVLDLRLFAYLTSAIVALKVIHSTLEYKDNQRLAKPPKT